MVFISYSWDSKKHVQKINKLVTFLQENHIMVEWDGNMPLGTRITTFMESSINSCEYVLFICTPEYKRKSDMREGGVGYESNIISGDLYNKHNELKYIPVLFEGDWNISVPNWAKGKLGIDLRYDEKNEYEKLLKFLSNKNKIVRDIGSECTITNREEIAKLILAAVLNTKLSLIRLVDKINYDSNLGDTVEKLQNYMREIYVLCTGYDIFLSYQEISKAQCIIDTWNEFVPIYNEMNELIIKRNNSEEAEKKFSQFEVIWNAYHKRLLKYCNEMLNSISKQ